MRHQRHLGMAAALALSATLAAGCGGGEDGAGEATTATPTEAAAAPESATTAAAEGATGDAETETGATDTATGGTTDDEATSSTATVKFAAPVDGAVVAPTFSATTLLEGFELDPEAVGKATETGRGHIHFQLDGGTFDKLPFSETGELAAKLGVDGTYSPNVVPQISYKGIPAGEHTLTAFLVGNDHANVGPKTTVRFTVAKDAPKVTVTVPSAPGSSFTATAALANFQIDAAAVGKAKADGRGHIHWQLDGGRFDLPEHSGANGELAETLGVAGVYSPAVEPQITYKDIPAGTHVLTAYLANNDHSLAGPAGSATFVSK